MLIFIAFFVTLLSVFLLIKLPVLHIAIDLPNDRSLHQKITPRTGGVGLVFGVMIAWLFLSINFFVIALCLLLCCVSLLDDIRGLTIHTRFSAHFLAAVFLVLFIFNVDDFFYASLAVIAIVWMTNLYNFMDGIDGLAGGMAFFGFSSYSIAAYMAHDIQMATITSCVASSSLAFLILNFSPAKIFMGDAGSIVLGFLVGVIGFLGIQKQIWAWWFPILVFSPFIVDATVTILKRLYNKEKIWQAHKSHYYQRLIQMGWSHRKTAIVEYVLMLLVGMSALLLTHASILMQMLVIGFWSLIYLIIMIAIDKKWHNFQNHKTM